MIFRSTFSRSSVNQTEPSVQGTENWPERSMAYEIRVWVTQIADYSAATASREPSRITTSGWPLMASP
jgi:hypothetical protein